MLYVQLYQSWLSQEIVEVLIISTTDMLNVLVADRDINLVKIDLRESSLDIFQSTSLYNHSPTIRVVLTSFFYIDGHAVLVRDSLQIISSLPNDHANNARVNEYLSRNAVLLLLQLLPVSIDYLG